MADTEEVAAIETVEEAMTVDAVMGTKIIDEKNVSVIMVGCLAILSNCNV